MTAPAVSAGTSPAPSMPSPLRAPFSYFARCTENRVEDDYDGGLLVFTLCAGNDAEIRATLTAAHLAISASHDSFLDTWPASREDKQARYFRITIEEVDQAIVPPDPFLPQDVYDAQGRKLNRDGSIVLPIQWMPGKGPSTPAPSMGAATSGAAV